MRAIKKGQKVKWFDGKTLFDVIVIEVNLPWLTIKYGLDERMIKEVNKEYIFILPEERERLIKEMEYETRYLQDQIKKYK